MKARWGPGLALSVTLVACGERGAIDGAIDDAAGDAILDAPRDATEDARTLFETEGDAASDAGDAAVAPDAPVDATPHVCPTAGAPMDCSKGTGTGEGDQCKDAPSCYVARVQKAVNDTVAAHPTWFDTSGGCPKILAVDAFLDEVVARLSAEGYCAIRDPNAPGEEISMKKDNAFTENFDIVASTGCARSGTAIYTGYCAPAWW